MQPVNVDTQDTRYPQAPVPKGSGHSQKQPHSRPPTRLARRLRRRPAPNAHYFWRFIYPVIVAAAAVAVFVLAGQGGRAVLVDTIGQVQEPFRLEPDEPGYLELVDATPTLLALHTHEAELTGVTLMARPGINAGGGVVLLPVDVAVMPPTPASAGWESLAAAYQRAGAEAVLWHAESLFGLGFDHVVEVPTAVLATLMEPIGTLPYVVLDDLVEVADDGSARVVYEAGRTNLSAAEAAAVYSFRSTGEAAVNRLERQRAMWEVWVDVVRRAEDSSTTLVPSDDVMSSFLRAFSVGTFVVDVPPVQTAVQDDGASVYHVLGEESRSWLRVRSLDLVPWPTQPASFFRPRVQLLDGTGVAAVRNALVDEVVAAGGVVTVMGNASEFGVESTRFAYHRPELMTDPHVNNIAYQLGLNMEYVLPDKSAPDLVDITLTVGLDRVPQ